MSLSLDTLLQAVELVQKAIEIYQRINDLPKQMTDLGQRLEKLSIFLGRLEMFAKNNAGSVYDGLFSGQKQELAHILKGVRDNVAKAYDLFDRYEKGIISREHDITFRVKWAAQLWFSLVDNTPEKVEALMQDIDHDRAFLGDYLGLMNAQGIQHMLNSGTAGKPADRAKERAARPAPSRKDYSVIFIDPYNVGRSVIAEAWLRLFMEWTLASKANAASWRIGECRSAGLFVKNKSDCVGILDKLDYTYPSFKKPFAAGNASPDWKPREALFANKRYDYPQKQRVEETIGAKRSRGVTKAIFREHDYIIVFTNREHDNMVKLKEALVKQEGASAAPWGKARLLMLGAYLSPPTEVLDPPKNPDGTNNKQNWERGVAQIKSAVEAFLRDELQWEAPGGSP
ncbi:hypothetical protein GQ53DRAFT_670222 [Thozetella sp. PMI_491]|nr:hypothetical protein GQ53DRAFT_670222 [Thozetella sp. PMI_491]